MAAIWLAFFTGLTTGGLSCLAVQGGLLTSTLADELEQKMARRHLVKSLLAFLTGKIFIYTLFGILLGWLGTVLQLTSVTRGILQLTIGLFLLGSAARMLNVHPIFRYFSLNIPRPIMRFIRRRAKNADSGVLTAGSLGLLTIFIPCGITQAMMAVAIATGNPWQGAALMFAFTLGASPVFFIIAYLATRLGESLHSKFNLAAACLLLIFGLITVEGGLNLLGSPISYAQFKVRRQITLARLSASSATDGKSKRRPTSALLEEREKSAADSSSPKNSKTTTQSDNDSSPPAATDENTNTTQVIEITVLTGGYFPLSATAKADRPSKLVMRTEDVRSCARAIVIPKLGIQEYLPITGETTIELPAQPKGRLAYSCSMGMYIGEIVFN